MGADMICHLIALPYDDPPDLPAAAQTATTLAQAATFDEVATFAGSHWYDEPPVEPHTLTEDTFGPYEADLRNWVETQLHRLLDEFAESLTSREVCAIPLPGHDGTTRVYLHATGGPSWGDAPTAAYQTWDRLLDPSRQPHTWSDQLTRALGLLRPDGTADVAATTIWRHWT